MAVTPIAEKGPAQTSNNVASDPSLTGLNAAQLKAVTHDGGPLLIVAGAGTGKTTVITRRLAWLIATGRAKPEEILALTFTNKAAEEMTNRVDELLPLGYADLHLSTFHVFCRELLEEKGLDIGLPNDFRLIDETDAYLLIRQNFDRFPLDYYRPLASPTKFIKALIKHFSRAKDEDVSPPEYLKYVNGLKLDADDAEGMDETKRLRELAEAYHVYQQILLENDSLDFGDLQTYAIRLLRERPAILAEMRRRFKYVLVDEFQDTNWSQYELVKMLVGPQGNLTVVGDDDQSIYKFRGASVANILQFKTDFPTAKEVVLTENYRSRQGILDLAYSFIQKNNPNRLEARLTTSDGQPLVKRLTTPRAGAAVIEHCRYATHEEEVSGVVEKIISLKEADADRNWNDFAVLVRSNLSADDYSREFQRRGVPYQFLALRGLYAKPVILDCLAWFALLDDYHESPALYRILSSPPYSIPGADLIELAHEAKRAADSLYSVIKRRDTLAWLSAEARVQLDRLTTDLARHQQIARDKNVTHVFLAFLIDSGYLKLIKSGDEGKAREQFGYLHQLLDRLKKFEETHDEPTVRRFRQEHALTIESGDEGGLAFDPDVGPDMVRILTVHAAKGLEFPYVFIVDLVDKRFPTVARGGDIELPPTLAKEELPEGDFHLEEERRLFYVALTRAKDGIFLTSAEDYGGKQKKKPSLFLNELGLDGVPLLAPTGERLSEPAPAPTSGKITLKTPSYLSFSQVAAYDNCPLQYKYAHVIRIPSFGKPTQSFGNTMHNVLEWFMRETSERSAKSQGSLFGETASAPPDSLPVSLDELLTKYEELWQDEWYESRDQKDKYRAKGREMLKLFYSQCQADPPKPRFLEQEFSLKLGEFAFKGKVDRIDDVEGGVEIVDYKTGKPKTAEDLDFDAKRQLLLYQIAAERLLGLKPVRLTFCYLQDGSRASFLGTDKQLAKVEEQVQQAYDHIKAGEFEPTPGHHCRNCDFRDICEFRE
ncbi:MAG: ATP-dependent DNA helicase [Patescibacteria group bacterium]|nr:ATP-dependent DNA helicase [Patescibacteria group bacterium]